MSKSVKLSASAATTGRKKNTAMTSSEGATKHHAALARLNGRLGVRAASDAFRGSAPHARRAPERPVPPSAVHARRVRPPGAFPWRYAPIPAPWAPASLAPAAHGRLAYGRRRPAADPSTRHDAAAGRRSVRESDAARPAA